MARSARWALGFICLLTAIAAGGFVAAPWLLGQGVPGVVAHPKELNSYRDVVKKVLPAVVSIESRGKVAKVKHIGKNPQLPEGVPEEFRHFFEGMGPGTMETPEPSPVHGFGSGFIVDPKGVLMTNHHVVAGADEVVVHLQDGRKFTSKDIKSDPKTDLAIVHIDTKQALPYLEFGNSDEMEIGDRVLAVGAPFGLEGSVTAGIISAKGRNGLSMNMYEDFLQTDAAINPGNSGGPLVNLEGKVVGINSAIKTRSGGFQGVGLAIASNLAKHIKEQLEKEGVVHRGYLGVQIKDLGDKELASRLGLKEGQSGVLVASVFEKAPAAKAGLQAGDVIVGIDGKPIKDSHDLQKVVATLPLKKPVEMKIVRDGKEQALKVTVEEQPAEFGTARTEQPRAPQGEKNSVSLDKVGVEVSDLTPELADKLGYRDVKSGAVVTSVEQGSLASDVGLRRGTLIVKVDKQAVKDAAGFKALMEKASLEKGVLLQVQTPQGGTSFVLLKSAAATTK